MSALPDQSFPKKIRLGKSAEYERVFGKGVRIRSGNFDILSIENSLGISRLGLVVSKKNLPSAVGRNRVKRVLREVFRKNNNLFGSRDFLFLANRGSENIRYAEALEEIGRAMLKKQ